MAPPCEIEDHSVHLSSTSVLFLFPFIISIAGFNCASGGEKGTWTKTLFANSAVDRARVLPLRGASRRCKSRDGSKGEERLRRVGTSGLHGDITRPQPDIPIREESPFDVLVLRRIPRLWWLSHHTMTSSPPAVAWLFRSDNSDEDDEPFELTSRISVRVINFGLGINVVSDSLSNWPTVILGIPYRRRSGETSYLHFVKTATIPMVPYVTTLNFHDISNVHVQVRNWRYEISPLRRRYVKLPK
ncbi:unnamed protein product, partial [Nesidiocoris tenuis]